MSSLPFSSRITSAAQVHAQPSLVPPVPGVYGWFFDEVPPGVPTDGCERREHLSLLYVGISPRKPSREGNISRRNLRTRLRSHVRGNARGSTLRLTLGCLLTEQLGIQLRRVGSGGRMTFTKAGEARLSEWMGQHAFVAWVEHEAPWELEDELVATLSLPLNLMGNTRHPFRPVLSRLRSEAKEQARLLPIVSA